jgi:hypothetical protein
MQWNVCSVSTKLWFVLFIFRIRSFFDSSNPSYGQAGPAPVRVVSSLMC